MVRHVACVSLRLRRIKECPLLDGLLNVISVTWFSGLLSRGEGGSTFPLGSEQREEKKSLFFFGLCVWPTKSVQWPQGEGGSSGPTRPTRLTFRG